MSRSMRAKRKIMNDVERYQAIKRQQELRKRPFKSLIYKGKKAVEAVREMDE